MSSVQPADLSPYQFAGKVLSALNQFKGSHAPYEFYDFVKDSLKRKHQTSSNLDIEAYQREVALEISQTNAIGENYVLVQETAQSLMEKIQNFKKSELSKKANSPKQIEERYETLVAINHAFTTMKSDLAKIEKDQVTLLNQQVVLQRLLTDVSNLEKNQNRYVNEFSEVYGHMIMEQSQFPQAANHLASIGNHFSIEIQGARAESEKLRGLKHSIEIPLRTNTGILKLLREKSYTDLASFFVDFGFAPELAASLLAEYEIKKKESQIEISANAIVKAERAAQWTNWRKRLVTLTIAVGTVGGLAGGYEKIVDRGIEQSFARSEQSSFSVLADKQVFIEIRNKYTESRHVPGELKAIIDHPEQVIAYMNARPKGVAMTPETKLYLLSYSPYLFRTLKFENFMPESTRLIAGILDSPQTRNFNNNERRDLKAILDGLKKQYEYFSDFVNGKTGIFTNGDPATLQATSDKFFKDRDLNLIRTPFQIKWETKEQFEAWIESNVDPKLKEIFEFKDKSVSTEFLRNYVKGLGSIGNIEFFYLLKNLKSIPAEVVSDERHVNNAVEASYMDSNLMGKTDLRIDVIHRLLISKFYHDDAEFTMAPLTPLELKLAEKYIEESSKTWNFGKPGYAEKILTFFNIQLKAKSDSAKTTVQE